MRLGGVRSVSAGGDSRKHRGQAGRGVRSIQIPPLANRGPSRRVYVRLRVGKVKPSGKESGWMKAKLRILMCGAMVGMMAASTVRADDAGAVMALSLIH